MRRLPYAFFFLLIFAMLAAGCRPAAAPAASQPASQPTATSALDEIPQPGDVPAGIQVDDALGRRVTFAAPPQRIVLAGKSLFMVADALYAFPEAAERVVALGSTGQGGNEGFIPVVDPTYGSKTILDGQAGPEQIAAVRPDAVVLKSFMAEQLGAPLGALGIPVVYVDLETPDQYERDLLTLGQLFQNEGRARQILRYYQDRLAQVTQVTGGLSEAEKPSVLVLYYSDKDGEVAFNVPPLSWIQTQLVETAGGAPVWADANPAGGWTKVSFEQVAAWNPDYVYVIAYFNDPAEVVANLHANPQWRLLRAVQEQHLAAFPGDFYSWDQPDPRWILGQLWLAKSLHPERFAGLDLATETQQFYQELYGLEAADFQQEVLPLVKGALN
jgi:iron complex transport system substrate-binding protein